MWPCFSVLVPFMENESHIHRFPIRWFQLKEQNARNAKCNAGGLVQVLGKGGAETIRNVERAREVEKGNYLFQLLKTWATFWHMCDTRTDIFV